MKEINIKIFNYNFEELYKKFLLLFILYNSTFLINIEGEKFIDRKKSLLEGKKYIQNCFKGILLNNNITQLFFLFQMDQYNLAPIIN